MKTTLLPRPPRPLLTGLALVLSLILSLGSRLAAAQTAPASAYTFTASQGTYAELPNEYGTVNIRNIQQDDNELRPYLIGFAFKFENQSFDTFVVDANGWLSLGYNPRSSSNNGFDVAGSTASRPLLAPLWDDLNGDQGQAYFLVEGTAPNRTLTVEWRRWRWPRNAFDAGGNTITTISFEVKLYETSNVIEYCYRREPGVLASTTSLSADAAGAGRSRWGATFAFLWISPSPSCWKTAASACAHSTRPTSSCSNPWLSTRSCGATPPPAPTTP